MKRFAGTLMLVLMLISLAGCGTVFVIAPDGPPIQLLKPVKVYGTIIHEDGNETVGKTTVPAGWWIWHRNR